jgi:hypothetical protein
MPIAFSCACGRALRAKDELAGCKIKCPQCGAVVLVPQPEAAPEEEEAGLLPLDDPWADAPARAKEPPPAPADGEVIGEFLPADPEEDEDDDNDDGRSMRETVRRREERAEAREAERERQRRRKRRAEEQYEELVEKGRFNVEGSRGYFGNMNAGVGAGVALIAVGLVAAFFSMLLSRGMGHVVIVIPVGAIVGGIAAILVGLNRQ